MVDISAPSPTEKILQEARRIEEDALNSSKGHFYAGQSWTNLHLWIGVPAALLAGIAGASALSEFDHHNVIAGILALVVAALTAVATFLNPQERAAHHHNFGNEYNALRNKARIFAEIEHRGMAQDEALRELKELDHQRDELNKKAPQIPKWAFRRAQRGIAAGEASYGVDAN